MVYLNLKDTTALVYVPANGWAGDLGALSLLLRNTTDRQEVAVPITDASVEGFLVRLAVSVPDELYAGEWEYTLTAGEVAVATGLVVVYTGRAGAVEYESENKVIQYGG